MVLTVGTFDELRRIAGATYEDHEGTRRTLLTADEVRALSLSRGNLDDVERREVESHVVHTYRFLQQIPWTRELRAVPEIALAHHEKLDGSGYPHGVGRDAIPLEARIITVVDIFDALTASDRPYKRAVTSDYALGVLRAEAEAGMLDADLVEAFAAARVWEQPESTASAGA
jgi:HD-GYP domain-containing protein (c-di-GMP phosphodiesterase class II)